MHGLFRSIILISKTFEFFWIYFFCCTLILLWSENILCMILILVNFLRLFMTQHVLYLGKCCVWKEYVLCCRLVECAITVNYTRWVIVFFKFMSLPLICLLILLLRERCWNVQLYLWICLLSYCSVSFLFVYLEALLLGKYTFTIIS